jgi:hypothetical protein
VENLECCVVAKVLVCECFSSGAKESCGWLAVWVRDRPTASLMVCFEVIYRLSDSLSISCLTVFLCGRY